MSRRSNDSSCSAHVPVRFDRYFGLDLLHSAQCDLLGCHGAASEFST